ncbi:GNAT family N-acetyltransferase [Paenibacillus selenitireducens]|uniref:GNAT family N-acetyltransferase n=1 Tax=Paenibacillus selenitireducens TaxID=1324314 RepID=A0A1T2X427_9BACL|nr:GNAT family N-acetyltransferase [Paenibacillus selenitireducens]OPA74602.1 GNAT family N-acetyltransferase [Paenibacillus selenitireducens]
MIIYRTMTIEDCNKLKEIDRSEAIDYTYEYLNGALIETDANHECPSWDQATLQEIENRFAEELTLGGRALGAFDGDLLIGFGVLAHRFRGVNQNILQLDLMYVSRSYRRQGVGTTIMNVLSEEARSRGAKYLYISSTETRSAVYFYQHQGGQITDDVDPELFEKEPFDIHMLKEL